jgi:hypothetical protein
VILLLHIVVDLLVCFVNLTQCDLTSLSTGEKKKGLFNSLKKKKKGRKSFLSRSLTHISELRSSHRRSVNFDLKQQDGTNADTTQPHSTHANQKYSDVSLGQTPESPSGRPENLSFEGEGSPVDFSPGSTVSKTECTLDVYQL